MPFFFFLRIINDFTFSEANYAFLSVTSRSVLLIVFSSILTFIRSQSSSLFGDRKPAHIGPFQFQQHLFSHDASALSGQAPVRSDAPVAGHNDANRIMADGPADCLG